MRQSPSGHGRTAPRLVTAMAGIVAASFLAVSASTGASATTFVDDRTFGMHVPGIAAGVDPTVSYGSVRLWDSGVTWGTIERRRGAYSWASLDRAIAAANAQNLEILYVLGSTPRWAAQYPNKGTYPNRGAASPVKSLADWRRWVTKVVQRHGASIDAYQIWNEANLATFWQGSPRQMAVMTLQAKRIIKKLDPTAKVVAASSTVRLRSAFDRFFPAYLTELRRLNWPVNVFSIHTYGPSTATPALRAKYVALARTALRKARAPKRPLWDTEINYGIKGPGLKFPDKDLPDYTSGVYVAQTYLDSVRLNIARTYWYAWLPPVDLLGITMYDGTAGAVAYQTTRDWLAGATVACRSTALRVCFADRAGVPSEVAWVSTGPAQVYTVPMYATRMCDAFNNCQVVVPGTQVSVGRMPLAFSAG